MTSQQRHCSGELEAEDEKADMEDGLRMLSSDEEAAAAAAAAAAFLILQVHASWLFLQWTSANTARPVTMADMTQTLISMRRASCTPGPGCTYGGLWVAASTSPDSSLPTAKTALSAASTTVAATSPSSSSISSGME